MRTTTLLKWCAPFAVGLAFSAGDPPINEDKIKRSVSNLNITIEIVDNAEPASSPFSNCFYYILLTSSPLSYMAFYGNSMRKEMKKYTKDKNA